MPDKHGWIKVDEDLPDDGIEFDLFADGGQTRGSMCDGDWLDNGGVLIENVTHWHPGREDPEKP